MKRDKIKPHTLAHIQYEKATNIGGDKGELTERCVIPTFIPDPNMKALDVTNLSEEDRQHVESLYQEYTEYYTQMLSTLFSFEDWVSHTRGEEEIPAELKWRTFKLDNVKKLD